MAHTGAAIAFNRRAKKPKLAHFAHDRRIKFLVAVRFQNTRHQFFPRVGTRRITHHALFVGQLGIKQ